MDLSIIIPSYNTRSLLDRCLTSVFKSTGKGNMSTEVIVVDNGSTDASVDVVRKKFPKTTLIINKTNVGYGRANNQAIIKAKGAYILLLNSDIQVIEEAVGRLYSFARLHPNNFIGGKLLNEDGSPQPSCGPDYSLPVVMGMLFLKGDRWGLSRYCPNKITQVAWVSGACLIGTRDAFVDVGLFDEDIFMYMEEIEFLYRAQLKGYTTLFLPQAQFIHTGAGSSGSRTEPVANIYRGLLYFYKKHRSIIEQWILRFLLIFKAYLAISIGRLAGKKTTVSTYEQALRMAT